MKTMAIECVTYKDHTSWIRKAMRDTHEKM